VTPLVADNNAMGETIDEAGSACRSPR